MTSLAYDLRTLAVTVDYRDGRVIDNSTIDPTIKAIDWNEPSGKGRIMYTAAEVMGLTRGPHPPIQGLIARPLWHYQPQS